MNMRSLLLVLVLFGCDKPATTGDVAQVGGEVAELRSEIAILRTEVARLSGRQPSDHRSLHLMLLRDDGEVDLGIWVGDTSVWLDNPGGIVDVVQFSGYLFDQANCEGERWVDPVVQEVNRSTLLLVPGGNIVRPTSDMKTVNPLSGMSQKGDGTICYNIPTAPSVFAVESTDTGLSVPPIDATQLYVEPR